MLRRLRLEPRLLITAALCAVVAIAFWSAVRSRNRGQPIADMGQPSTTSSTVSPSPRPQEPEPLSSIQDRESVQPADIRGTVRFEDESPCVGAEVTLTSLDAMMQGTGRDWFLVNRAAVAARTSTTATRSNGDFGVNWPSSGPSQSSACALWVTSPDAVAQLRIIMRGDESNTQALSIVLKRAAPLAVVVRDAEGVPVDGAEIQQFVLTGSPPVGSGTCEDLARRVYARSSASDVDGSAHLPRLAGVVGIMASRDGLRSEPWFGNCLDRESITLILMPTFGISGHVRGCLSSNEQSNGFITIVARRGSGRIRLGGVSVDADGRFSDRHVPWANADELEVSFLGAHCESVSRTFSMPLAGDNIAIEFDTNEGLDIDVEVTNSDGGPIPGATVWATWKARDSTASSVGSTTSDGSVTLDGCRAGKVIVRATAPGYATQSTDVELPTAGTTPVKLRLEPAGKAIVRVRHEGVPVSDFDVVYQAVDPLSGMFNEVVRDSVNGEVVLDSVPTGSVYFVAQSQRFARSEANFVSVGPRELVTVDLEVPSPLMGRGRVLDAVTGLPVEGAWVQVYTNRGAFLLLPWGKRQSTDIDGSYEVSGFAPGETRCMIGAPGYAIGYGRAIGRAGETIDLGDTLLSRLQSLRVTLIGDTGQDYSKYSASAGGVVPLELRHFSAEGEATWTDVGAGSCWLGVSDGEGGITYFTLDLQSGSAWDFSVVVGGRRGVEIVLLDAAGVRRTDRWVAYITSVNSRGARSIASRTSDENGIVRVSQFTNERVVLEAVDFETGNALATEVVEFRNELDRVQLRIGGTRLGVRVVDSKKQPLVGCEIRLTSPLGASYWDFFGHSGSDGWTHWGNIGLTQVDVHLYDTRIGSRGGLRVELEDDVTEVEFELSADARVRLRTMDGDQVLSGVPVEISDPTGTYDYGAFPSDAAGLCESRPVHEGEHVVRVRTPSLWPVETRWMAREDERVDVLQLRRRGNLELTLENAGNARIAHAQVHLESIEFSASVADWTARNLCRASSASLTTDAAGRLSVEGLPRGDYRWRCGQASGELTVAPLGWTRIALRVE